MPDIYKELGFSAGVVWLYFHLTENETITGGWVREDYTTMENMRDSALVVSLSAKSLSGKSVNVQDS